MNSSALAGEPRGNRVLESIQHLRGLAVSMVVLHHSTQEYPTSMVARLDLGQSGVATFFAISGFIIWTSSRRETVRQFVERRLIRIVPMYWAALATVLAIGIHSWGKPIFAPVAIVKSLLFIPYFAGSPTPTPYPVLVPGWTLNFEMLFYTVFAIGMLVGRPLLVSAAIMGSFFLLGQLFTFAASPLVLYTKWVSILFVAGLLIGWRAPANSSATLLWPIGFPLIIAYNFLPYPQFVLGGGIVLLIVGLTAYERVRGWPNSAFLEGLGNASYAIYLFHMPALFLLHFALVKAHLETLPWIVFGLLCLGCAWTTGFLIHRYVEKPLGARLRRIVQPARTA